MSETSSESTSDAMSTKANTGPAPWGVWFVGVLIGSGFLTAMVASRVKPVGWFSFAMGVAVGVMSNEWRRWCQAPARWWIALVVGMVAAGSTATALWVACQRVPAPGKLDPKAQLAERMLQQFPISEDVTAVRPMSAWQRYLTKRYRVAEVTTAVWWLLTECLVAAAVSCAANVMLTRIDRPNRLPEKPL